MFAIARKKNLRVEDRKAAKPGAADSKAAAEVSSTPISEEPSVPSTVSEPVKAREPVPEDQQSELFKWILEEKRKVKSKHREEKKRIDEEKATLKHFIHAESIPQI